MFDPILTDRFALHRYEVEEARWRDRCARSREVEERLHDLRMEGAELEVEEQEMLAPDYFKPPSPPHVWECPTCERMFPTLASAQRHIEVEHAEEIAASC